MGSPYDKNLDRNYALNEVDDNGEGAGGTKVILNGSEVYFENGTRERGQLRSIASSAVSALILVLAKQRRIGASQ